MVHNLLKLFISSAILLMPFTTVKAQRNFYNRLEIGAGNVWSFVAAEMLSMITNSVVKYPLSEATLRFCVPKTDYGNLNSFQGFDDWNFSDQFNTDGEYGSDDFTKFNKNALLSNIIIGEKLGYLSDNMGNINFCFYGAPYYNLQKFKLMYSSDSYNTLTVHKMQLGGGAMIILGSIESNDRFIFDAGIRYNIPLGLSVENRNVDRSAMNKGITSHYMAKWSYRNNAAVGFTFDLMHYNMFNDPQLCGSSSKIFEFGITLALMIR